MTQHNKLGKLPKLLMAFILLNVIDEVGNIIAWLVVPDMRISLDPSILATSAGEITAFTLAPQVYY